MKIDLMDREVLQVIEKAAIDQVSGEGRPHPHGTNQAWKRAYEDLAQAATTLDAFLARSTVHSDDKK
ncbi:MAG: hypothetical protein AAB649_06955 [Patescibacteria group bacterium]